MKTMIRVLGLMILGSNFAFAAPPTGTIGGHVTYSTDGSPFSFQYVYLIQCTNDSDSLCTKYYVSSAQTDATGLYSFDLGALNLAEGTYQLHVNGGTFSADGTRVSDRNSTKFYLSGGTVQVTDVAMTPTDIQVVATTPCSGQRVAPNSTCALDYTIKNVTKKCLDIDAFLLIEWNTGSAIGTTHQQLGANNSPVPQRVSLAPGQSYNLHFAVKVGSVPTGSYFFVSLFTSPHGRPYEGNGMNVGWLIDVVATP